MFKSKASHLRLVQASEPRYTVRLGRLLMVHPAALPLLTLGGATLLIGAWHGLVHGFFEPDEIPFELAFTLVGALLLVLGWLRLRGASRHWQHLLDRRCFVQGSLETREEHAVPGGRLTFAWEHGQATHRTVVQGKGAPTFLDGLRPGDPVTIVFDPQRPRDGRVRDWLADAHSA